MKKSSKPTLLLVLILLLIVTVFALLNVGVKLKYEQKLLLKDKAEKIIKTENQKKIKLFPHLKKICRHRINFQKLRI